MTTLTETAYYTRKTVNWIILGVIAYIILRIFFGIISAVLVSLYPPKAPLPNHAFNKLPALVFPQQASPSGKLTFQLETIQGSVPEASPAGIVYFMPKAAPNLLALNQAQKFADNLQFDPTPIQETKSIYRFNDSQFPLRTLRFDIVSSNFILRYAFERDLSIFAEKKLPQTEDAKQETLSLLQQYSLKHDDLNSSSITVSFLKLTGDQLVPTTSLSQSDAERVDIFRKPIGAIALFTPFPDQGAISIVFSGSINTKKHIIQFAYTYWPIDYQTIATYPLKKSSQAWAELQQGQGYIARYPKNSTTVTIRNVYLGYYDSFEAQNYLQPIFVFEGDNGFLGYVPAVDSQWIE
jgi:hypothetical protein